MTPSTFAAEIAAAQTAEQQLAGQANSAADQLDSIGTSALDAAIDRLEASAEAAAIRLETGAARLESRLSAIAARLAGARGRLASLIAPVSATVAMPTVDVQTVATPADGPMPSVDVIGEPAGEAASFDGSRAGKATVEHWMADMFPAEVVASPAPTSDLTAESTAEPTVIVPASDEQPTADPSDIVVTTAANPPTPSEVAEAVAALTGDLAHQGIEVTVEHGEPASEPAPAEQPKVRVADYRAMLDGLDAALASLRNADGDTTTAALRQWLAEVQSANCPTAKPADRRRATRLIEMARDVLATV